MLMAWNDLGTCRAIGMDVGPIPWTAAREYAATKMLDSDDFEMLWLCIGRMEEVYREYRADLKKRREERAKRYGNAKRASRR